MIDLMLIQTFILIMISLKLVPQKDLAERPWWNFGWHMFWLVCAILAHMGATP